MPKALKQAIPNAHVSSCHLRSAGDSEDSWDSHTGGPLLGGVSPSLLGSHMPQLSGSRVASWKRRQRVYGNRLSVPPAPTLS